MLALTRWALFFLTALCLGGLAAAQEDIRAYDIEILVEPDADIVVTETIRVKVEGRNIRRGIFRELPAYYQDEEGPGKLPFRYQLLDVLKDGADEPYARDTIGNAIQIRIGDPDVYLDYREHTYQIRYRVKNAIRYRDTFDELYWNATGVYWAFPIQSASVTVRLPDGARVTERVAYTGGYGSSAQNYTFESRGDAHTFRTSQPLGIREGLTISLSMAKGVIEPPSVADRTWLWWARNGALAALVASFLGLLGFYYRSFDRIGRDPTKGPVFPQYEPPAGYSPVAAHHIYYRGFRGHQGLIAGLMALASQGHVRIELDEKDKKKTTLSKTAEGAGMPAAGDLADLFDGLFAGRSEIKLGDKYDASFTKAYQAFRKAISGSYGSSYFKWNLGYVLIGGILAIGTVIYAATQASYWSGWHTFLVLALVGLNGLFMYLMPAPTEKGQDVRTHLQGFRLYMDKAESLQLNAVEVGSTAPPPMTIERYESFLPYAVALGVEKPWTKHFERLIPEDAANYNPTWTNMSARSFGSMGGMTDRMVSGMSSGVSTALPQSSSSSGSGGGGFSGGGGGGGGGGGW